MFALAQLSPTEMINHQSEHFFEQVRNPNNITITGPADYEPVLHCNKVLFCKGEMT